MTAIPGLLRELSEPPPWADIEPEDFLGDLSSNRAAELRPLIDVAQEHRAELLVGRYELERQRDLEILARASGQARTAGSDDIVVEWFREQLSLATLLGRDVFWAIHEAVFGFDEFTVAEGAPDLFLWAPEQPAFWLFSEVKASGDSLREPQKRWLDQHWELVSGHYVITVLQ